MTPGLSVSEVRAAARSHKSTASQKLPLQWAKTMSNPSLTLSGLGEKVEVHPDSRQRIVTELYPRLLYTFSDVVCYITNNPRYVSTPQTLGMGPNMYFRATESELMQLFEWAVAGHELTVNQRVRPGLIIVVNKDVPSADKEWLEVDYATKTLLSHLELSPAFARLREVWKARGRSLSTAEDLIHCYYDSFRIICIPTLTNTTTDTIAMQYQKLYDEIKTSSDKLRKKKIQVGMNLDVESFDKYMGSAFSRLAKDLTSSIDFHYMASKDTDRPTKFREHVTNLLVKLKVEEEKQNRGVSGKFNAISETAMVNRITPFIACCLASKIPPAASSKGWLAVQIHFVKIFEPMLTCALNRKKQGDREILPGVSPSLGKVSRHFLAL
jgi:hypothetical protein